MNLTGNYSIGVRYANKEGLLRFAEEHKFLLIIHDSGIVEEETNHVELLK